MLEIKKKYFNKTKNLGKKVEIKVKRFQNKVRKA